MWRTIRCLIPAVLGLIMMETDALPAGEMEASLELTKVSLDGGVVLHYVECGAGVPVVFIHGGLEDYSIWTDQLRAFGNTYRAIVYSRRYNFPNGNEVKPNHSAAVEAEDLAALMRKLGLGKSHIIGFSYGGTTALFLAVRHPELVRTLTLAEPALAPWLADLPAPHTQQGRAVLAEYNKLLVEPARVAFAKRNPEDAVRITLDYLVAKKMFDTAPQSLRDLWMRNARELEAICTSGLGLSAPDREQVRRIKVPTLLLSGGKSAPSCQLADVELEALLAKESPHGVQRVLFPSATHAMWIENPEGCRKAVLEFLRDK